MSTTVIISILVAILIYLLGLFTSFHFFRKGSIAARCFSTPILIILVFQPIWVFVQVLYLDGKGFTEALIDLPFLIPIGLLITGPLIALCTFSIWSYFALIPLLSKPRKKIPASQFAFAALSIFLLTIAVWGTFKMGGWPRLKPGWRIGF
ncbi:MAG: hypothetical protein ACHQ51_10865 [Elusimicrobiota bacterium]